jgi:hypothetical protein
VLHRRLLAEQRRPPEVAAGILLLAVVATAGQQVADEDSFAFDECAVADNWPVDDEQPAVPEPADNQWDQ